MTFIATFIFIFSGLGDDDDVVTSSDDSNFDVDVNDDVSGPQSHVFRSHTQNVAKNMGLTVLEAGNGREKGQDQLKYWTRNFLRQLFLVFFLWFSETLQESSTECEAFVKSVQHRLQLQRSDVTAR